MEMLELTLLKEPQAQEQAEPKYLRLVRAALNARPPVVRFAPPREPRVVSYR